MDNAWADSYIAHWVVLWEITELLSKQYYVKDVCPHCLQFCKYSYIPCFIVGKNHSLSKMNGLFIESFSFSKILIRRQRRESYLDSKVGISQYISNTEELFWTETFSEIWISEAWVGYDIEWNVNKTKVNENGIGIYIVTRLKWWNRLLLRN